MKAFILTAILTNEFDRKTILEAVNSGIQRYIRVKGIKDASATIWSVQVAEEFNLERQDI